MIGQSVGRVVQVEGDDDRRSCRETVAQPRLGEEDGRSRIIQHEREAFRRITRVERHERPARLEDGEQSDGRFRRPLRSDGHEHPRPHSQRAEAMRQSISTAIKFAISQRTAVPGQSDRVGVRLGPRGEQLMDAHPRDKPRRSRSTPTPLDSTRVSR